MVGWNRGDRAAWVRFAGASALSALSAGMIAVVIYDVFTNTLLASAPLSLALVKVLVPLTMAVLVGAAAFLVLHDDGPAVDAAIVIAWATVGVAGVAVTAAWTVGFQNLQGAVQLPFVLGYAAMWGAIVGLLVGVYDVRRRRRRRDLERINELNAELRAVNTAIVTASSRDEIERGVCDRLTNLEGVRFAWFGDRDEGSGSLVLRSSSGDAPDGLGRLRTDGGVTLQAEALRSGEPVVRANDRSRSPESVAAIPVLYGEFPYGVLTVGIDREFEYGEFEGRVLANLGRQVGDAINALRSREALLAERVVELTFEVHGEDTVPTAATAATGGRLALRSVQFSEGALFAFYEVDGVDPRDVVDALESIGSVASATVVHAPEDGSGRIQVVDGSAPYATVADHGGRVVGLTATAGRGELRVRIPRSADVRATVDAVAEACPDAGLVSRRDRPGPIGDEPATVEWSEDALTERQLLVARTAYHGGYFEAPRHRTGEELAASLGVSAPTFHDHLRAAERRLFEAVFEGSNPPDDDGG